MAYVQNHDQLTALLEWHTIHALVLKNRGAMILMAKPLESGIWHY